MKVTLAHDAVPAVVVDEDARLILPGSLLCRAAASDGADAEPGRPLALGNCVIMCPVWCENLLRGMTPPGGG